MAIFLAFYKLFLEKESMHFFKRYFLLAAIACSFVIPAIVFTEVIYIEPISNSFTPTEDYSLETYHAPSIASIDYTYWSLLTIYVLGVLFFSLKFFKNLYQIKKTIQNNPKQQTNSIIKVLLSLQIVPHTFFNYIFLNKQKFEANEIPPAVLLHEETHAKQKHSIDILVLEILQIVCWFNPLIYLFKKSIKLNHEFLADSAVLNNGLEKSDYQKILLAFSSNAVEPQLANAINYSSIKKRFTVMKKETSRKGIVLRSTFLLPILAILLLSFSETKTEFKELKKLEGFKTSANLKDFTRTVEVAGLVIDSKTLSPISHAKLYDKFGNLISTTDSKGYYNIEFDNLESGEIMFEYLISKNGYKQVYQKEHWGNLNGKIASCIIIGLKENKSNAPEFSDLYTNIQDLSYESVYANFVKTERQFEFNKKIERAKKDNQDIVIEIDDNLFLVSDTGWIKVNSKNDVIAIDNKKFIPVSLVNKVLKRSDIKGMTPLNSLNNASFALFTSLENFLNHQNGQFSNSDFKKYNTLAKKYNAIPIEKRIIPLKDLKILETIYRSLSAEQKAQALPFPECLPKHGQQKSTKEITININDKGALLVNGYNVELKDLSNFLARYNTNIAMEERKKTISSYIVITPKSPKGIIKKVEKILSDYGVATIDILGNNDPSSSNQQKNASTKQVSQYNALAKKYNKMLGKNGNVRILKSDVDQMTYIYGIMSDKQKESAQPFPDFPEPPPAPEAPEEPKAPKVLKEEKGNIPLPPPPPAPKSPLDFVVEMAKKGATFMYEGDNISSDKAIDLMKNNKELNIDSRTKNGEQVIKITKDPILISIGQEASTNKNVNTYIKERNKLLNYIKVNNIDYPVGYLALSKLEQTEFNKIQQAMFQAYMYLSENEKQSAPKILPPPPSAKMYKLEDGKVVKKV